MNTASGIAVIIQARMSSSRFPGKVLAPFLGRPLLACVADRLRSIARNLDLVLATSVEPSDDPLAQYGALLGLEVVRGPLDDVVERFRLALQAHPCRAFFRVCADSPALEPFLFTRALELFEEGDWDLVTNVFPRTYPPGLSVELVGTESFLRLAAHTGDPEEREHVTQHFYRHPQDWRIRNIRCSHPADPALRLAVDEVADLRRVERWLLEGGGWPHTGFEG